MTNPSPSVTLPTTGDPRRWLILAVMLTAEIMDLLDATVVNVAGPDLERSLGAGPTGLQWVIGGYALALGAGLVLGGRLGDRFGRRRMFLIAMASFTLASLLCALAPTVEALIVLRLLQGAAGAMLLPQGFGLLRAAFSPPEIGKAFAIFGPVFGIAGILGPIIGGGLIQADVFGTGWRFVFVVNVPLGIAAVAIASRILPRTAGDRSIRIDALGAVIVAISAALLVLPLVQGRELGWPIWTWASVALALAGFVLFALQQRRRAAQGRVPLVDPGIFQHRAYTVGLIGIALYFAGSIGIQLVFTLFLQIGQRFTAGEAGLSGVPLAVGSLIGGAITGAVLANRLGRAVLQIGAVVQGIGVLWLLLGLASVQDFTLWQLVGGLIVSGLGSGLVVAALFDVVLSSVDNHEVGSASGVLSAVQSIAAATGVAAFGTVFFGSAVEGAPADGFRAALTVQALLIVAFLLLSPVFPRRAKTDGH